MTGQELANELGRKLSTIQSKFERTKERLEKKGIIINRIDRNNYTIEYLENAKINSMNLTKYKFGKLQPLYPTDKRDGSKNIIWHCQCDCGNECDVSSHQLIWNRTQSCSCLNISHGELKIQNLLNEANISYITEYQAFKFKDTNCFARYDFFVNNLYFIEFDGEQHFHFSNSGWNTEENFNKIQERDKIKNKYCKDNNIPLVRIPYTHLKELCLEDLLLETTKWRIV